MLRSFSLIACLLISAGSLSACEKAPKRDSTDVEKEHGEPRPVGKDSITVQRNAAAGGGAGGGASTAPSTPPVPTPEASGVGEPYRPRKP